jgi:hypothetical protein
MNLDNNFYKKLIEVCARSGVKPEDALAIMTLESGLKPNAVNKDGGAAGLVQFMPYILKSVVKYDPARHENKKFNDLSGSEQLDYIEGHFKRLSSMVGGQVKSAAQLYIGNFYPVALTKGDIKAGIASAPIVRKNPVGQLYKQITPEKEAKAYSQNYGLDADKDGVITYGDIQKKMAGAMNSAIYKEAIKKLNAARANQGEELDDKPNQEDPMVSGLLEALKTAGNGVLMIGDRSESFQFARVLKFAIQENFKKDCDICCDNENVGLYTAAKIDDEFINMVKSEFEENLNTKMSFVNDVKLNLNKISVDKELSEYRLFLLKRLNGNIR